MFEKTGNLENDELFIASGGVEIDMIIKKEKRKEDRNKRSLVIRGMLKEKGLGDPEFIREFSKWYEKELEIIEEIEDRNEYNEEQVRFLMCAAEIFSEIGLRCDDPGSMKQALERLEGTEEAEFMDGALFDATQKADAGIIDKKIVEEIKSKIAKLKQALER